MKELPPTFMHMHTCVHGRAEMCEINRAKVTNILRKWSWLDDIKISHPHV